MFWLGRKRVSHAWFVGLFVAATLLSLTMLGVAATKVFLALYMILFGWALELSGGFASFAAITGTLYVGLILLVETRRRLGHHRRAPNPFRRTAARSPVIDWLAASPLRGLAHNLVWLAKWPTWLLFQIAGLAGFYLWMELGLVIAGGTGRVLHVHHYWGVAAALVFVLATWKWFKRHVVRYPVAGWTLLLRRTGYAFDRMLAQLSGRPQIVTLDRGDGERTPFRPSWDP